MQHSKLFTLLITLVIVSLAIVHVQCANLLKDVPNIGGKKMFAAKTNEIPKLRITSEEESKGIMDFAINIGRKQPKQENHEIMSPISVAGALSLLLLGAKGETFDQIQKTMHFNGLKSEEIHRNFGLIIKDLVADKRNPDRPDTEWKGNIKCRDYYYGDEDEDEDVDEEEGVKREIKHTIHIGNGIFLNNEVTLNKDYENVAKKIYQSEVRVLDFEDEEESAADQINNWVNNQTHGKIPKVISSLGPETIMVIASTLYFKAQWQDGFIDRGTLMKPFYPEGISNPPVITELMSHSGCFPYYYDEEWGLKIMGFPYKENLTTMYIILPDNSSRVNLINITSNPKFNADFIEDLISKMIIRKAAVVFPKMHVRNTIHLRSILTDLGLTNIFDQKSDLSLMSEVNASSNTDVDDLDEVDHKKPFSITTETTSEIMSFTTPLSTTPYVASSTTEKRDSPATTQKRGSYQNKKPIVTSTMKPPENETDHEDKIYFPDNENISEVGSRFALPVSTPEKCNCKIVPKCVECSFNQGQCMCRSTSEWGDEIQEKIENLRSHNARQKRGTSGDDSLSNLEKQRFDLSLPNAGLLVSSFIQKIDLAIDEEGTEGGAATVVSLDRISSMIFRVNTPFVLLIRHDSTKVPLFYGNVYNPSNN